jgi:hypothetical protein
MDLMWSCSQVVGVSVRDKGVPGCYEVQVSVKLSSLTPVADPGICLVFPGLQSRDYDSVLPPILESVGFVGNEL